MNRFLLLIVVTAFAVPVNAQVSDAQLARLLKRFPDADLNGDGKLTNDEANRYRKQRTQGNDRSNQRGISRQFSVNPGWDKDRFPEHAVCYKSPEEIAKILGGGKPVVDYPKPSDGSLRIVGTGHSFMAPGYKSFPKIVSAAGFKQPPLLTHTGGGMTGSARYKWEQENGIFQFDGKPKPILLSSIAGGTWDAMMWGPYYNDRPEFYLCWMDFCLKYNPQMKFYLSDAWPQLEQFKVRPTSEKAMTAKALANLGKEKYEVYGGLVDELNKRHRDKVFVLPTSDAMVIAAEYYHKGLLPGVEGIHRSIGGKERSLWRDPLGHLGPGFGNLEGYVFYATLYGRSPELIKGDVKFGDSSDYPSPQLDRVFRKIAWEAVLKNPLSGVTDANGNKISDDRENDDE